MNITFDEESHTYTLNGIIVPSVTNIVTEVLGSGFEFLNLAESQWYMDRGKAIHACASMIAKGIPFEIPDERIIGHVEALRKFFSLCCKVEASEKIVASEVHQFAGTLDLICEIGGKRCIVDFKSSCDPVRVAVQLGGYSVALGKDSPRIGYGCELREDGTFSLTKSIDLVSAGRNFLACRAVFSLREKLNLLSSQRSK